MNGVAVLKASLEFSLSMVDMILADLSDADLLVRPVPHANHTAWQLGHLISSEREIILSQIPGADMPFLPAGFAESHSKATSTSDDPKAFYSKSEYLELLKQMRAATLAEVGKLTDADLDRASAGNLAGMFPTLGRVISLLSDHIIMHLGQTSVVRRKLGKPVLF